METLFVMNFDLDKLRQRSSLIRNRVGRRKPFSADQDMLIE